MADEPPPSRTAPVPAPSAAASSAASAPPLAPKGGVVEPDNDIYKKRMNRARSINKGATSGAAGAGSSFSLDLSGLTVPAAPVEGDHKLGDKDVGVLTTPRAGQEEAITVRGEGKYKHRKLFKLGPETFGSGPLKCNWRPGGEMLATASKKNGVLLILLLKCGRPPAHRPVRVRPSHARARIRRRAAAPPHAAHRAAQL